MNSFLNKNILSYAVLDDSINGFFSTKKSFFKVSKIVFWIISVYTLIVRMAVMLGSIFEMEVYLPKTTPDMVNKFYEKRLLFILTLIMIIAIIVCFIMLKKRFAIAFISLGLIDTVISFSVLYNMSQNTAIKNEGINAFWSRFGVPSLLFVVMVLVLGVLILVEKVKIKRVYNKIVESLYKAYVAENVDKANSASFDDYLDSYSGGEVFRTDIPLKKSVKLRKNKQDKENN